LLIQSPLPVSKTDGAAVMHWCGAAESAHCIENIRRDWQKSSRKRTASEVSLTCTSAASYLRHYYKGVRL